MKSVRFLDSIERCLKLVTLDPRCSAEGSKAYRWIPNCILYEIREVDEWFLKNRTNGPYLIGRDGYYVRDRETWKPLIWDRMDNRAKAFDGNSIRGYALERTLKNFWKPFLVMRNGRKSNV